MILSWLVATVHVVALPLGLGGLWARGNALRGPIDRDSLRRVFAADGAWGIAGLVWIGTGVWRAFGGLEKGTAYYLQQPVFHAKLGLVALTVLLELWPMATLIRWRIAARNGGAVDAGPARSIALISRIQVGLVLAATLAATALARGMFGR